MPEFVPIPEATPPTVADPVALLHTPAQAAELLNVRESWLRRKAGQRQIPASYLGKHLRFSDHDLHAIVDMARRQVRGGRTPRRH
ncbi:helix-turn-helix domain-containing protein [Actinokineospora terrae]|uniref:DNA binding domain-containing protein, excisionase family n=1 Tax=Actinokineospora terrae TaxID=155974 RepID=A0A1H9WR53_9PSEU|nr:helix-turn-helix domain-containing protein [Actinokineospora terrae]SES36410.1 DNA binding domain-containing protein, excisionase family [Actinokineospora terrae]